MNKFGLYNTKTNQLIFCKSYEDAYLRLLTIIKQEFLDGDSFHDTWAVAYIIPERENRIEQLDFFDVVHKSKLIPDYDVSDRINL